MRRRHSLRPRLAAIVGVSWMRFLASASASFASVPPPWTSGGNRHRKSRRPEKRGWRNAGAYCVGPVLGVTPFLQNQSENAPEKTYVIREIDPDDEEELLALSKLCVDVFYNDARGTENEESGPLSGRWKEFKLGLLRKAQMLDLTIPTGTNRSVFIARKSRGLSGGSADARSFDGGRRRGSEDERIDGGEIVGYCEVVEERLDLSLRLAENAAVGKEERGRGKRRSERERRRTARFRPVIANLSVRENERQSGVGSDLVRACESAVRRSWTARSSGASAGARNDQVFAQVEEENVVARKFFERCGYREVFVDPTCKKVVADGAWFIREVDVTKVTMSKDI